MQPKFVLDLGELPDHGFGTRSLTWWGTVGMFAIESTTLAIGAAAYLYLMGQEAHWPPVAKNPDLSVSTVVTLFFLLSLIPNVWLEKRAEHYDLRAVRVGMVLMSLIGAVLVALRLYEFKHLNVQWDTNAYGSAVWGLLGLHTAHLVTDLVDTVVLAVLLFTPHGSHARRFVDSAENAMYWNFVVIGWLPVYAIIYLLPRWL
ncbi:MAG: heme-copper oxidase subunit III [Steroidobacteraceae bacterium]